LLVTALPHYQATARPTPTLPHADTGPWRAYQQRKLLVAKQQLQYTLPSDEMVKGIDYHAKVKLIAAAISKEASLEVTFQQNGQMLTLPIKPLAIEKKDNVKFLKAINKENWYKITLPIHSLASVKLISFLHL
jgi:hypothetical protein